MHRKLLSKPSLLLIAETVCFRKDCLINPQYTHGQSAAWFFEEVIQTQIVFIDENGFNVWTPKSQSRALRVNTAFSTFGLVHHLEHIRGPRRERFQTFLHEYTENVAGNEKAKVPLNKSRYECYYNVFHFQTSLRMPSVRQKQHSK